MPPPDKSITTLWVGGIDETVTEEEIRYMLVCLHAYAVVSLRFFYLFV